MGTVLLIAIAVATVVLGFIGFSQIRGSSVPDSLWWSLQLLLTRGGNTPGVTPGGTPVALDIARFLALIVIASIVLAAAFALVGDRLNAWRTRHFTRGHTVLAGAGSTVRGAVEALRATGATVVVLDVDPRSNEGHALRRVGARVLAGDAAEAATARDARVAFARHVVVMTGHDGRNLAVLGAAASAVPEDATTAPRFHVELEDEDSWTELSQTAIGAGGIAAMEFFNLADHAALALVGSAAALGGSVPDTVVLDGRGAVEIRVVVHVVRRALIAGRRARIAVAGERRSALLEALERHEPWTLQSADIVSVERDSIAPVAIIAGYGDDAACLARAMAVARDGVAERVIVGVDRVESAGGLRRLGLAPHRLHVVGVGGESLAHELLDHSNIEILARARHEDYLARAFERGASGDADQSLVEWERLPESLKESNRRFAEAVASRAAVLGAEIRPMSGPPMLADLQLDPAPLDALAEDEHVRWVESLRDDGWSATDGPKNPDTKVHPLLVPWSELPESEREKDRDVFRALPRTLAMVGYELRFPGSAPQPVPA